nr:hypothetical protein [Curtobacterium ammoniigenes]
MDDETRAGLKQLGAEHGRSMEGEARVILAEAVRSRRAAGGTNGLGSRIHALFAGLDWEGVERQAETVRVAPFDEQ